MITDPAWIGVLTTLGEHGVVSCPKNYRPSVGIGEGAAGLVESDQDGIYRAVCTVKFAAAVFELHCFAKKSKRGIETPKEEMDIARAG